MRYFRVGKGGPWPAWIQALRGRSGFYSIRDAATKQVLHAGRSTCGGLYQRITRHFQSGAPHFFVRARVEVAVATAGDAGGKVTP